MSLAIKLEMKNYQALPQIQKGYERSASEEKADAKAELTISRS